MSTAGVVLLDTCTISNFAAVGGLTLLRDVLDGRGAWTEAVAEEVRAADGLWDGLLGLTSWLPPPIVIDDPTELAGLMRRRRAMGGDPRRPLEGLGEAESVHVILSRPTFEGAAFVTDDEPAAVYAERQGVEVWRSADVLATAYERELVTCPQAYDMLVAMRARDRGVRVPVNHWMVCPPRG